MGRHLSKIAVGLGLILCALAAHAADPAGAAAEELREGLGRASDAAADAWSLEITKAEGGSVTLGMVVIALAGFALGLVVARLFTHRIGLRALHRAGVDEGAAHAYASLAYYALGVIVFLVALRLVAIPLTAFAVVGGALAIGVGFGSQNVVNNFISGVILLAERPIKRGDLIQVEQTYGNVERIGLRSTRIRTGENIHVIVPNSAFLETRVVNWTHNDAQVRLQVDVGVAYGSPTREVERRILAALEEHERVLETPGPIVLFTEFGDNSLNFRALFWVRVRNMMDRMKVESELRYQIDDLFREADITIAFPQRDVHLDASAPLPVKIVADREP